MITLFLIWFIVSLLIAAALAFNDYVTNGCVPQTHEEVVYLVLMSAFWPQILVFAITQFVMEKFSE